jgi:hypothetical protein
VTRQILNDRLTIFVKDKDIIRREQIGFVKGCRTSDHLFIIQTINSSDSAVNVSNLFTQFWRPCLDVDKRTTSFACIMMLNA